MKRMKLTRLALVLLVAALLLPGAMVVLAESRNGAVLEYDEDTFGPFDPDGYLQNQYVSAEEKLEAMQLVYTEYGYELYTHVKTGEVAVRDTTTGQVLFSNPYDLAVTDPAPSGSQREELLSQIILSYKDTTGTYTMTSYHDAVMNNQVQVSRIRGGIRVQYTIGQAVKRKLAPRQIAKSRFDTLIMEPIVAGVAEIEDEEERLDSESKLNTVKSLYQLKDPGAANLSARDIEEMTTTYPYTKTEAVYVLTTDVAERELDVIQALIKEHTDYTMEDMQQDHNLTGYVLKDDSPPVFQMSLEYLLEEGGFSVRLPARGITFDSSLYKLLSVSVLPYFGAGHADDFGYNFIPDGAGALIDYDDITATTTVAGDLYGTDFSFHSASGGTMESWRMPVYGLVTDRPANSRLRYEEETEKIRQGYVAFMTEGDALTRLTSYHGGTSLRNGSSLHPYNSVYPTFYPRQVDSYPLQGITVSGGTATYEIDAPRSYVGNFTTKYRFLWQEDASYVGMAEAWRKHLIESGQLSPLTDEDGADIPLYINAFGDIDTKDYILGVPVNTKTALTTFAQAETMISLLKGKVRNEDDAQAVAQIFESEYKGREITVEEAQARLDEFLAENDRKTISNLNLQYTGWYNGGMTATPASKLKAEKALGGVDAAQSLSAFAKESGAKIFYDLEYTFISKTKMFDAFSFDTHAAKTVEGAMTREKVYDPVSMAFKETNRQILSATAIADFYDRISEKYDELGTNTISLASLGGYVNTDHTEENAVNREEAKELIVDFVSERHEVQNTMLSGGNAYIWACTDHLLNIPLDSSARLTTSREVPFIGMVLHGYMDYSGASINLAGDYQYSILKALENGASPSFTLSFDNTSELKSSGYSKYYSIQFAIWYDDLIDTYTTLNGALGLVRQSPIVGHEEVADRIIEVTYENGVKFLLNYNNVPKTYGSYELDALGFVVVEE